MIKLSVELFGNLKVTLDGNTIFEYTSKPPKHWCLFAYMVCTRKFKLSVDELFESVWGGETASESGSVKNAIYLLRRDLSKHCEAYNDLVIFKNGTYYLNENIAEIETDTEKFEELYNSSLLCSNDDLDAVQKIYNEMLQIYKGDFLPQLEDKFWVIQLAAYYKNMLMVTMKNYCELLFERNEYSEIIKQAKLIIAFDPLNEQIHEYVFRAMLKLKMHDNIVKSYLELNRIFYQELGQSLNSTINDIYFEASKNKRMSKDNVWDVKSALSNIISDNYNSPNYCTYDVFKQIYYMTSLNAQRTGQLVEIVLLTLMQKDGSQIDSKRLNKIMDSFADKLSKALRRNDIFTKQSKSQYILLIQLTNSQNIDSPINRIIKQTSSFMEKHDLQLVVENVIFNK